jgi:hypothetical protein
MKRWVLLFAVSLCFSAVVSAQAEDNPKLEAFVGYSYYHFEDPGNHLGGENAIGPIRANLNGGSASISYNPFKYLGIVGDFGEYASTEGSALGGPRIFTYLFGPKVALRTGKLTPFGQLLFGGARLGIGSGGLSAFAWAAGVGLDVNLTHHIGVRLAQLEYLRTSFSDGITNTQDNIRASAGVTFRF